MPDEGLTVFNGRYTLLRRIARGGMADVYLARDAYLDREVAVKVLFPEFANDRSFVERFRREAKTAANLNHPNIVGIFDWGEQQGTYYIVMEFVVGRSLADVLRSTGPLSADRAAKIARDVANALSNAHAAGLVHRDIKLGNIMVSDEGQVKVTDFGIATALARRNRDNKLTEYGSVIGTATYFSPEQAQAKPLDGRSDLYSLGVVLYEMIVGRAPFIADTSTAVAVQHVKQRPVAPSKRGAVIAQSLEAIILKLLAKNPKNRYPKADFLARDLNRYLSGEHQLSNRASVVGSSGVSDGGPPLAGGGTPSPTLQPLPPGVSVHRSDTPPPRRSTGGGPIPPGSPPTSPPTPPQGPYERPPDIIYEEVRHSDGWKRTLLMLLGLGVLIAALVYLGLNFWESLELGESSDQVADEPTEEESLLREVPDVVGLNSLDAQEQLFAAGLREEFRYEINTEVAENVVFAQSPAAGQRVNEGITVVLTVSEAEKPLVPYVRGRYSEDARGLLTAAGYVVIALNEANQAEAGIVIRQEPEGNTELSQGEAVTITVSSGPSRLFVPEVATLTPFEALQTLDALGLRPATRDEPSETVPQGEIIGTDPPANSPIAPGSSIDVVISSGVPLISVPEVEGLLFDTGKLSLEREGLAVGNLTYRPVEPGSADVGRILDQTPLANEQVPIDTPVDLVVGEPAEVEPEPEPGEDTEPADGEETDPEPTDTVPDDGESTTEPSDSESQEETSEESG